MGDREWGVDFTDVFQGNILGIPVAVDNLGYGNNGWGSEGSRGSVTIGDGARDGFRATPYGNMPVYRDRPWLGNNGVIGGGGFGGGNGSGNYNGGYSGQPYHVGYNGGNYNGNGGYGRSEQNERDQRTYDLTLRMVTALEYGAHNRPDHWADIAADRAEDLWSTTDANVPMYVPEWSGNLEDQPARTRITIPGGVYTQHQYTDLVLDVIARNSTNPGNIEGIPGVEGQEGIRHYSHNELKDETPGHAPRTDTYVPYQLAAAQSGGAQRAPAQLVGLTAPAINVDANGGMTGEGIDANTTPAQRVERLLTAQHVNYTGANGESGLADAPSQRGAMVINELQRMNEAEAVELMTSLQQSTTPGVRENLRTALAEISESDVAGVQNEQLRSQIDSMRQAAIADRAAHPNAPSGNFLEMIVTLLAEMFIQDPERRQEFLAGLGFDGGNDAPVQQANEANPDAGVGAQNLPPDDNSLNGGPNSDVAASAAPAPQSAEAETTNAAPAPQEAPQAEAQTTPHEPASLLNRAETSDIVIAGNERSAFLRDFAANTVGSYRVGSNEIEGHAPDTYAAILQAAGGNREQADAVVIAHLELAMEAQGISVNKNHTLEREELQSYANAVPQGQNPSLDALLAANGMERNATLENTTATAEDVNSQAVGNRPQNALEMS